MPKVIGIDLGTTNSVVAVIEGGVRSGAPRVMAWFGAFGLLTTLVWLYLEILRFLALLRGSQ